MPDVPAELIDTLTAAIHGLLNGKKFVPVVLPEDYPDDEFRQLTGYLNRLVAEYESFGQFMKSLSRGDLDHEPPRTRMAVAGHFKSLQAHLRHLTYAAQRIAGGDFAMRIDFMGDFATAFNKMTSDLKDSFEHIEAQKADLARLNADLSGNIRELTRTRNQLAESEHKLRSIIEAASDAIIMIDIKGRAVHWNPAAERMFGFTSQEILGHPIQDHIAPPGERRLFAEHFTDFISSGVGDTGKSLELTAMRRDLSLFPVEVSFAAVDYAGQRHCLAVVRDITERWKLDALKRDVERITRHDLKSPLNAVIGVPDILMEKGGLPPEDVELLGMVKEAGYRMLGLINLSLDLYKMETGTYVFHPKPLDVIALVRRVVQENQVLAHSRQAGVVFTLDGAQVPPEAAFMVSAEELLCYSMFSNLVKNALEATPTGGEVTIGFFTGNPMRVSIHNQLPIPEGMRERFFAKYATSGKLAGTGLGAYSARLMALTQQGDLRFTSSPEAGTTLTVSLGAARADA